MLKLKCNCKSCKARTQREFESAIKANYAPAEIAVLTKVVAKGW